MSILSGGKVRHQFNDLYLGRRSHVLDFPRIRAPGVGAEADPVQQKEINFLKKHRRRSLRNVLIAVVTAAAVLIGGLFAGFCVIERELEPEALITSVEMEGNNAFVTCTTMDSGRAVTRIRGEVKDGVLELRCLGTLVGIHQSGSRTETIPLDPSVREIRMGRQILWKDGVVIAPAVSRIYEAGHAYVGSMPDNLVAADAVDLQEFGSFSNELQTEREPYGWTISYPAPFDPAEEAWLRIRLRADGILLIAATDNLGSVTFEYRITEAEGDLNRSLTVTREEGDAVTGHTLRECIADPVLLQQLYEALRK